MKNGNFTSKKQDRKGAAFYQRYGIGNGDDGERNVSIYISQISNLEKARSIGWQNGVIIPRGRLVLKEKNRIKGRRASSD